MFLIKKKANNIQQYEDTLPCSFEIQTAARQLDKLQDGKNGQMHKQCIPKTGRIISSTSSNKQTQL